MTTKEILEKLPASWEEMKLKDYLKTLDIPVTEFDDYDNLFVGIDNVLRVAAALSGATFEELQEKPLADIEAIATKLKFTQVLPEPLKESKFKWKKPEDVTYGDFVYFHENANDLQNALPTLMKLFSTNKLEEDEILEMSMAEVHTGFFTLREAINIFLDNSMISMNETLIRQDKEMTRWQKIRLRFKLRTNLKLLKSVSASAGTYYQSK